MKRIDSPHFDKDIFKSQLDRLVAASDRAQEAIDFASAHDPEIGRAILTVEDFLRRKGRLCYGGQAINAHLPKKHQFYDPQYTVPDYDFFTPDQASDIKELTKDLLDAGFEEISSREGMHAGTKKLYVNFVPVADLSEIDERLYTLLKKREYIHNDISYMDVDTLRMLMYLELSRPKGEVSRWEKVFERLMILNEFAPVKPCYPKIRKGLLSHKEVDDTMDYIVKEQRVFAGCDLKGMYKGLFGKSVSKALWIMETQQPIFFYSSDIMGDTKHFAYELQHSSRERTYISRVEGVGGDLIPQMSIFMRQDHPFLVIIEESACHAFYKIPLPDDRFLRVATMDTLITLYFSIALLEYKFHSLNALGCLAKELVEISYRARNKPDLFPFPYVSLQCSGHQKGMPSLIRSKVRRIRTERLKQKQQKQKPRKHRTEKKRHME